MTVPNRATETLPVPHELAFALVSQPPPAADRLRKANLTHRSRDDKDADVVGERIRRDDEEAVSVGAIAQRAADDDLIVYERDLDAAPVLRV